MKANKELIVDKTIARLFETKCRDTKACETCSCKVLDNEEYKSCQEKYEDLYLMEDFEEKMRMKW